MAFLDSQNIAHCDLKPHNLVIENARQPFGKLFIIDFGNAVSCEPGKLQSGFQGTIGWTAPEVRDLNEWDPKKADVWAMGMNFLFFETVSHFPMILAIYSS